MASFDSQPMYTGKIASVTLDGPYATLSPNLTSGMDWNHLRHKVEQEQLFGQLVAGVPGFKVPKVLETDQQKSTVITERATGLNLSAKRAEAQGSDKDFFEIPIETRAGFLVTYLRAIDAINQQGYAFNDHKIDSVFIDPLTNTVTVVDAEGIDSGYSQENAFQREFSGDMESVLRSFFNRGWIDVDEFNDIIPAGIDLILSNKSKYSTAGKMADAIEKYLRGEMSITALSVSEINYQISHMVAKDYKDPELVEILNVDLGALTPNQVDFLFSRISQRLALIRQRVTQ
jgi:hypothetical protein